MQDMSEADCKAYNNTDEIGSMQRRKHNRDEMSSIIYPATAQDIQILHL